MGTPGPFANFDCDHCGACCRKLIVEPTWIDGLREPRLYQPDTDFAKVRTGEHCLPTHDVLPEGGRKCRFLDANNRCEIYPTRPNDCVVVEAGDAKCQQARVMAKLELLRDRDGRLPSRALLVQSCDEYGMDLEVLGEEVEACD